MKLHADTCIVYITPRVMHFSAFIYNIMMHEHSNDVRHTVGKGKRGIGDESNIDAICTTLTSQKYLNYV